MKRAAHIIAKLGLVPVLTFNALGGTHTISSKKAGIVKLRTADGQGQCTGAVVGTHPLTVLTAFHCLDDINSGQLLVVLENEVEKIRAETQKYVSTKAISSVRLTAYPEYRILQQSDAALKKTVAALKIAEAALAANPSDVDLQETVKNLRSNAQNSYQLREDSLEALKGKAAFTNEGVDLAIVTFEKYDGELNQKSSDELISSGALVPLSPNKNLVSTKVAFGGFGVSGEQTMPSPSRDLGAFTNVVQKQEGGLIATFGMLPGDSKGNIPRGHMGAILPGDSGGPLMNDYGIVGVASYIKPSPMETDRAPAIGWPVDRDGYYSYLTGRYADLSDEIALELIESARTSHKLNIEINHRENLALTDISSWNKPSSPAPLVIPNASSVVAQHRMTSLRR